MVRHIVMFKLKDNSPPSVDQAKRVLLSMKGKVKMLKNIEVGVDFLHSSRSFDLVLITDFYTRQDSFDYQEDEYHKTVVKPYMHAASENSVAIDYEY